VRSRGPHGMVSQRLTPRICRGHQGIPSAWADFWYAQLESPGFSHSHCPRESSYHHSDSKIRFCQWLSLAT
jgi:hypothetical protein